MNKSGMLWEMMISQGFLHPFMFQTQPPTMSSLPSHSSEQLCKSNVQKFTDENQPLSLDITTEDLLNAGYESNKTPWTEQEDEILKKLRNQKDMDWAEIAEKMPGRNSKMCYSRYRRLENHTKEIWKKADDKLLLELVAIHGDNWKQISKLFPRRTHKQVKQHYVNYLRPQIRRDEWTLEEDLRLVQYLNKYGKNWRIIEELFNGRTQNQIKNRYFGRLKRLSEQKSNLKQKQKAYDFEKTQ